MRTFFSSSLGIWLLVGIVLRLILMAISYHPDIRALSMTSAFLAYGGVFNVYDHIQSLLPQTSDYARTLGIQDVFIYPPLVYFTLGGIMFLLRPLYDTTVVSLVGSNFNALVGTPALQWYLFLSKVPYLIFDLGALFFMYRMYPHDQRVNRWLFLLWLFNPVTIYASYLVGNFDIIPIFFTIAATYFFIRKQLLWAFLLLGVGAGFKTYPILLGLPLIFYFASSIKDKALYFAALVGPYLLTSLPFLFTPAYRTEVLFNPKNTKFLYMLLPVSGAEGVYIFIFGVVLLCCFAALKRPNVSVFWFYPLTMLLLAAARLHH